MSEFTFETHAEYGDAFGECGTEIFFDFTPQVDDTNECPGNDAEVEINGGRFYSNGRWILLNAEEASNVHSDINDQCIQWGNDAQADSYDRAADHADQQNDDARLERE
jgi:hypothetical protein